MNRPGLSLSKTALQRRVRQLSGAKKQRFYAVVPPGFEDVAVDELAALGIGALVEGRGGCAFEGSWEDCWRVHQYARIPNRVVVRLFHFAAGTFSILEKKVSQQPWELWLDPRLPVELKVESVESALYHERAVHDRLMRWIPGLMRTWKPCYSDEPLPEYEGPQRLYLRFKHDRCTVSLDCSGELLFKRGYGKHVNQAPLRDNIAAALLRTAGGPLVSELVDPMTGSGTFGLEALLAHYRIGGGVLRRFAFEGMPAHKEARWRRFKQEPPVLAGKTLSVSMSDIDPAMRAIVERNLRCLESLGVPLDKTEYRQADFFTLSPPAVPEHALVILNPPYGARLGHRGGLRPLYREIGRKLRQDFRGCRYGILAPERSCEQALALPGVRRRFLDHGGAPVGFLYGRV